MSALGLLNFLVLQWFGVRLARWYVKVPDVTVSELGRLLERTLHGVLCKAYGAEAVAESEPSPVPMRRIPGGWVLMRWLWPLTGWWSDYRWISGARRRR